MKKKRNWPRALIELANKVNYIQKRSDAEELKVDVKQLAIGFLLTFAVWMTMSIFAFGRGIVFSLVASVIMAACTTSMAYIFAKAPVDIT